MNKATIVIGDSASITPEIIQKYGMIVVPFKVTRSRKTSFPATISLKR